MAFREDMLWFAFILLSLSYWKQLFRYGQWQDWRCDLLSFYYLCRTGNNSFLISASSIGCDLLSFYYLCRTGNNKEYVMTSPSSVVICFHFTIFVVLETTRRQQYIWTILLWFAFILLSLSYWKQHLRRESQKKLVVICFHFTIFVVLETTVAGHLECWLQLWFAFILLSLSYWKQLVNVLLTIRKSCDLLSFYYLCRTGNNCLVLIVPLARVVICFHFTIFVVLETTQYFIYMTINMLWFAFILLSLSYWKQPILYIHRQSTCCDLLSFYYLCRTGNNSRRMCKWYKIVVICFHFTIFVVLETTNKRKSK